MSGHKPYSQEFKLEAVKLLTDQGLTPHKLARALGGDPQTLRRWLRALAPAREQVPAAAAPGAAAELSRLRREVELVRQERDILKPSASSRGCHSEPERAVCGHPCERVPGASDCRVLGVSRSGYYAWRTRPQSRRQRHNRLLAVQIAAIFRASRQTYGSPRLRAELRAQGVRCASKRVARLMRQAGLHARSTRRRVRTTTADLALAVAPTLLNRDVTASAPNQKWLADITELPTQEGWMY